MGKKFGISQPLVQFLGLFFPGVCGGQSLQVINVISVRRHESGMELVVSGVENFDHQVELKTLAISN